MTLRRKWILSCACLFALTGVVPNWVAAEDPKPAVQPTQEPDSDREAALKRVTFDIQYMSSDEMGGRQPGTPGIQLCEDYIVAEYKKAGLKPLENGSYLQEMEVGRKQNVDEDTASLILMGPNDAKIELKLGENYRQLVGRKDFDLESDLVFVGYGISAEEHNYEDYLDDLDVEGKIVVLIRLEPQADDANSVFNGNENSKHAAGLEKVKAARRAGAAGILMVNDIKSAVDEEKDELIQADRFGILGLPFAQIKRSVLNEILDQSPLVSPTGKKLGDIAAVETLIDENLEPISQKIDGWKASFKSSFSRSGVKTNNIIGIIEGEGPHADETIVIGGHYDHLGMGAYGSRARGRKEIHNGADDNATGTAAIIELARRFNERDKKPGRRLVFICFTAEEMGLLGAFHYVNNPIFPLEKTVAMVNFDMIGWLRDDKLWLYNWNSSPDLDPIFKTVNKEFEFELMQPQRSFAGSDHLPFNQKQIPNMFIHTGQNAVYHTPEDDFEAINCEGALKVIEFSERVVEELAAMEKKPVFGPPKQERPFRLGVMLDDENDTVTIEGVSEGSVAEKAGLQEGDIIIEFAGEEVKKRRNVNTLIRREAGKTVKIKLKRGDAEVVLNVELKKDDDE